MSPSLLPHPKLAAAGGTGTAVSLVILAFSLLHVTVDPALAALVVTALSFVAGYLKKAKPATPAVTLTVPPPPPPAPPAA